MSKRVTMSKEEMIRYSLEKDNILDNFKKSELMWFMKILYKENKQLKERITYLENSNNRREETIISLRHEQQLDKYKEVIEEVRKLIEEHQKDIDKAKEFYSDLEDDDVVKVSNLQILNNQMVRNYDLLQILEKAKEVISNDI